jgi:hypothetical protein
LINSKTSSGTAFRVRVADDITRRPLVPDINRMSMPKSIQTQIHWFISDFNLNYNIGTSLAEFNFAFSLNQTPTAFYNNIVGLFDQYAIFAAYVRVTVIVSGASVTAGNPYFYTALDFDSVGNLGSIPALQAYSTVCASSLTDTQERYIEPCNAPALYSGSAFTHYGQSRMWVDTANSSTPHYGFRSMVPALGSGASGNIAIEVTLVVSARNSI